MSRDGMHSPRAGVEHGHVRFHGARGVPSQKGSGFSAILGDVLRSFFGHSPKEASRISQGRSSGVTKKKFMGSILGSVAKGLSGVVRKGVPRSSQKKKGGMPGVLPGVQSTLILKGGAVSMPPKKDVPPKGEKRGRGNAPSKTKGGAPGHAGQSSVTSTGTEGMECRSTGGVQTSCLVLKDVGCVYHSKDLPPVTVLEHLDFHLERGEKVALIGPSGAGKSTLLHICGLLEQPTQGHVFIDRKSVV